MELSPVDLMVLYLHETGSFDLVDAEEVPSTLTKEAVSIKCGMSKETLDIILQENKSLFKVRNSKVIRRRQTSDCIFLSSKGVLKAKEIIGIVKERRVEYINEKGKLETKRISEVREELRNFKIDLTLLDIYLRGRRSERVNLHEFMEPKDWKADLFRDHAFPEMIFLSSTSCMPYGGIFTTFGEPGVIFPIDLRIEVGIHPFGSGNVIRWMKRHDNAILDAYYIEGKKGFQSLVSGHSPMKDKYDLYKDQGIFEDGDEYKGYFDVLLKYDYSIIFSSGTGHGISMAGQIGTILAALAMHLKEGRKFPLNGMGESAMNQKLIESEKVPVWDFHAPSEPRSIKDMLIERHGAEKNFGEKAELLRKFVTLSQIFERHWNSSFTNEEMQEIEKFQMLFGLKEFSSGGACISSIFASPVLLNLDDEGRVSLDSLIYPDIPQNKSIGLIIDRKGGIDNPRAAFKDTFKMFYPLIKLHGQKSLRYFSRLKSTSGELSNLAAAVMLENHTFADTESEMERRAICDLLQMQKGIYSSLGVDNRLFSDLDQEIGKADIDMVMSPIGVGNSGTFIFCVPEEDSIHSLSNLVEELNMNRPESERMEVVLRGSSHRYLFNIDPLVIVRK